MTIEIPYVPTSEEIKIPEKKIIKIGIIDAQDVYMIMNFFEHDGYGNNIPPTDENLGAVIAEVIINFKKCSPERLPFKKFEIIEDHAEVLNMTDLDRAYRNAWHRPEGEKLQVHIDRAKHIHRDHLREHRAYHFERLDLEEQHALSGGDTENLEKIKQKKQRLRDVTKHPDIDKAKSVDDLKEITIETHTGED